MISFVCDTKIEGYQWGKENGGRAKRVKRVKAMVEDGNEAFGGGLSMSSVYR